MSFETISVIGLGYIGLPTAAVFASKGKKSGGRGYQCARR